jgi:hypothetical protein
MTKEKFIERVIYFVSDEYLQKQASKEIDGGVTRPDDFANAVAIGMIKFLIEDGIE